MLMACHGLSAMRDHCVDCRIFLVLAAQPPNILTVAQKCDAHRDKYAQAAVMITAVERFSLLSFICVRNRY
jgi:hypothetical protein